MIPDEVITQIRDASDIVAVIGQHVQLKKAGRNWKGLCPFHGEKTPSFNVSPDKGFFHCFGCQKHGDVFTFVMELEGKSFVEAAEQLAARFGIAVPKIEEAPEVRRARGERLAMLDLNKVATAFYREVLAHPVQGEPGRAYLAKRGVSTETADRFQLGYAPPDWGALADYLKDKRADLEMAVRLGLVAHRPRAGGYYDRNRDRLVCPVIVPGGDVVGFSSRVVGSVAPQAGAEPGNEPPKYINSPESPVYKKSKLLFGLAQAREAMAQTKRVVLVEGNFDVITLHQAGFGEVVAPLGTALTAEQIGVLKRLAERVVLLYDGDRAGYQATMHALQLCVEADVEVLVASRPGNSRSGGAGALSGFGGGKGVDPDSLVSSGGAEQLREAIDRAQGGIEFFAHEVWSKARNNVDARARALEDAARLAAKVATPVKRDLIVGTLAASMQIDAGVVRNAIARAMGGGNHPVTAPSRFPQHPNAPGGPASPAGPHGEVRTADGGERPVSTVPPREELEVIALLADHPHLIASSEADKAFWLLTDDRLRAMYSAARAGRALVDVAHEHLPNEAVKNVLSGNYSQHPNAGAQLTSMVSGLESRRSGLDQRAIARKLGEARQRNDRQLERLLAQLAVAERTGDRELVARLTDEIASNRKQVE